jgi:hypothetical protein
LELLNLQKREAVGFRECGKIKWTQLQLSTCTVFCQLLIFPHIPTSAISCLCFDCEFRIEWLHSIQFMSLLYTVISSLVNVADRKEGDGTVGLEKRILDFPSAMFCTDLDIGVLVHFLQLLLSWFSCFQRVSWTSASEEKIWS